MRVHWVWFATADADGPVGRADAGAISEIVGSQTMCR
jgi:hypothetical protein